MNMACKPLIFFRWVLTAMVFLNKHISRILDDKNRGHSLKTKSGWIVINFIRLYGVSLANNSIIKIAFFFFFVYIDCTFFSYVHIARWFDLEISRLYGWPFACFANEGRKHYNNPCMLDADPIRLLIVSLPVGSNSGRQTEREVVNNKFNV